MKINAFNLGMPYYGVLKKLVLIMKMIIIIMTICLVQVSAAGLAQKVTLNEKETPLQNIIQKIRLQTGYDFIIDAKLLDKAKKVTINVNNAGLEDALDAIFKNQQLSYSITDKVVAIEPKEPSFLDKLAERWADRDVRGRVVDEQGNPMPNASIQIKGTSKTTTSNDKGEFVIKDVAEDAILIIRYVGYKQLEIPVKGAIMPLEIKLNQVTGQLEEVAVKGNTGYQQIDRKHPGSFDVIDNKLLNRSISSNILDRIKNLTTGISFENPDGEVLIRGRNSIYSNVSPLIVLDNFPYDGDINNINPNDIESVTILKDAAATALWGARAGNGVIVLTTKRGKTIKPEVSLNTVTSMSGKPNFKNLPVISSADYIELEKWLFSKGYYDNDLSNTFSPPPITPVVELLSQLRNGQIDESTANSTIDSFKGVDVYDDLKKYFYKKNIQQYSSINISGKGDWLNYYISGGWDKNSTNLVGNSSNRINLKNQNVFQVSKDIQITTGLSYAQNNQKLQGNEGLGINSGSKALFPYADLVTENGKSLRIVKDFRTSYTDSLGKIAPLNWEYKPYDEIYNSEHSFGTRDLTVNTGFKYNFRNFLNLEVSYQYLNSVTENTRLSKIDAYSTRNLINSYYQPGQAIEFPIPKGGIKDISNGTLTSHQGRVQLQYNQVIFSEHRINAITGWEIKNVASTGSSHRFYGYSREGSLVNPNMDFVTNYELFGRPFETGVIQNPQHTSETLDRFISIYASLVYSFRNRYTISGSLRNDATNLFGVKTNQKGVPLWSVGFNWQMDEESFFKNPVLPILRLRTTYGVSGNFSRRTSAYATAGYTTNELGLNYAIIRTPQNDKLRWEQVRTLNFGLDFEFKDRVIKGSIDYYKKHNKDLMADAPIDPTMGIGVTFFGNVASMKGDGFEFSLASQNLRGKFSWETNLLFSYALNKVSKYNLKSTTTAGNYITSIVYPIIGKPIYSLYSFPWAGLDSNGDPQGYLGNNISKDYTKIISLSKPDSLIYHGATQPPYFGSLRNTISWKNLHLSFNINYTFGYYFRRNGLDYSNLFSSWTGHSDYAKRWQNPGDETRTNIPSLAYLDDPHFVNRDSFYQKSSALVLKGDNIRLQDVNITYSLSKAQIKHLPFQQINFYTYVNNINLLLWKANKENIDPKLPGGDLFGKTISIGMNITF